MFDQFDNYLKRSYNDSDNLKVDFIIFSWKLKSDKHLFLNFCYKKNYFEANLCHKR